eukprot:14739837-Alexandrium_andersonii.AAC.1
MCIRDRRAESEPSDVIPKVTPHAPHEVAPLPPRARAVQAPRRVNVTQAMPEEHGHTAGCLKCARARGAPTGCGRAPLRGAQS